jgi:hypothetical protein
MRTFAKAILSGALRVARGTAMGLAVMFAVVLGVATTALAAVPGDPFVLGKINAVNAMEDVIADGDKVVSRYTSIATDTEGFMGRPPTGKVIRTPAIQIFRFAGGRIVESWAVRDDLGTLRQLGHLPLLDS